MHSPSSSLSDRTATGLAQYSGYSTAIGGWRPHSNARYAGGHLAISISLTCVHCPVHLARLAQVQTGRQTGVEAGQRCRVIIATFHTHTRAHAARASTHTHAACASTHTHAARASTHTHAARVSTHTHTHTHSLPLSLTLTHTRTRTHARARTHTHLRDGQCMDSHII